MEKELEAYLHKHIPLSKAMGIRVEKADPGQVILWAPFAPNINHKQTVFGGSLHALTTLACWGLVYANLKQTEEASAQIVITKSDVAYLAPVDGDFRAECLRPADDEWQRFFNMLRLKGKARLNLMATIHHAGRLCVDYRATFAAIK
ncbi:conserved hypothetical protein [Candidatus Protochlamydia naegleriophila]|uniref:Thioesterase putative domain-containing protein n=1 Tax=Candidatus Protochlamydia naegleriophila TaxID=389348 RepID=A0A0U5JF18_9BACT|nr:YiiD C-terminal domain-containing protein [Candidatus Protochlamydia naegleriophila]CUI17396.1 conserved hypothetical protein [Candidatus Protochlamydia naegleriophila]